MKELNLKSRTDLRLTSKTSTSFKVKIAKSIFIKSIVDGNPRFEMKDCEDPKNPIKNAVFPDESKFITVMMNRVYYQKDKGIENPIKVIQRIPIEDLEDAIEILEETKKPTAKPKAKPKAKAKVSPKKAETVAKK
jgi:hypothetical protein